MKRRNLVVMIVLVAAAFAAGMTAQWFVGDQLWAPPAAMHADVAAGQASGRSPQAGAEQGTSKTAAKTWYTCGMHPEVVQDHPGDCPKCGMKLEPMSADRAAAMGLAGATAETPKPEGERKILYWKSSMIPGEIHDQPGKDSMGMDLVPVYADEVSGGGVIRIDPVTEQNMGVRIDEVTSGPLTKQVRTVGFIDYDERSLANVNVKVNGWIEKLYVEETGQQVHKGDPLFDIYSPELFSAQEEYLTALRGVQKQDLSIVPRSRVDSSTLVRDARVRLQYFDVSDAQIAELERTGQIRKALTINSPFTGIVTQKMVVEGQQVKAGMDVLHIADLSNVWVMAKVYEYDVPYVKLGQEAWMTLTYLPGATFRGRVTYVYPYLETKTREIPVRIEFHNPGYELKPGMYATVALEGKVADEATLVPDVAVINSGKHSVVFVVEAPGRFQPREVTTGVRSRDNRLQVLSGLAPGEKVVVSGQFLLDSESNLREAALKMLEPGQVDAAQPIEAATERAGFPTARERTEPGKLYYVCPMPEHADILYDKPGKCPLCGMELVPVTRSSAQPAPRHVAYWTCPMPEHRSVHESKPGKCPICGMTLIPVEEGDEQGSGR